MASQRAPAGCGLAVVMVGLVAFASIEVATRQLTPEPEIVREAHSFIERGIAVCGQDPRVAGWTYHQASYSAATMTQVLWTRHDSTLTCIVQFNQIKTILKEKNR